MRNSVLTVLAAALFAAGCSVDATQFTCHASTECPTGYHCDMSAQKCASGAPTGNPVLSSFAWDKTLIQPADHATITFTVSEPIAAAGFPPEVAAHGITLGALTPATTGAPATYTMTVTMPAACDGAGNNPVDDAVIPLSLAFTASGNRTGSGPIGTVSCTVRKTLGAVASKVRLVRQPLADGSVRSLISADPGAISSTPGFAGVTLALMNGNTVVASAAAQSDGSAQQFEVAGAPTQVSLAVLDRTGQKVNVTGYAQRASASFAGKTVGGTQNHAQAFDVSSDTNAMYPPVGWIANGPSPTGGAPVEYPTSVAASAGVSNSYLGMGSADGIIAQTSLAQQPDSAYTYGWQPVNVAANNVNFASTPPARKNFSVQSVALSTSYTGGRQYPLTMYGGLDASDSPVDPPGTLWVFDSTVNGFGWMVPQVTTTTISPGPFPSTSYSASFGTTAPATRAGTAMGYVGNFSCTTGSCNGLNFNYGVLVAGGTDAAGALTDHIYIYGERIIASNGARYIGWWNESKEFGGTTPVAPFKLMVPNANMAYASQQFAPGPNPTPTSGTTNVSVTMMVGGQGINAGNNQAVGCQIIQAMNFTSGPTFTVSSCSSSSAVWNPTAAAPSIGFRTGAALVASQPDFTNLYLFGGQRSGSAGLDGLQNDVWQAALSVVCSVGGVPPCATGTQQLAVTWTPVTVAGSAASGTAPSPRRNAQLAYGGDFNHLLVYGGSDASGPLQDLWEIDFSAATLAWKKLPLAAAPAIGPGLRTGGVLAGSTSSISLTDGAAFSAYLIGGSAGGQLQSDVWKVAHETASRMLLSLPTGISNIAAMSNVSLSMSLFRSTSTLFRSAIYAWDGTSWALLDQSANSIAAFTLTGSAAGYVQPDGNIYVLVEGTRRPTLTSTGGQGAIDALQASVDFQ